MIALDSFIVREAVERFDAACDALKAHNAVEPKDAKWAMRHDVLTDTYEAAARKCAYVLSLGYHASVKRDEREVSL